jgi:rifampin ADP-ribosylating transferase
MAAIDDLRSERFYHGTKADLKPGDLIGPGYNSNYGKRKKAVYVYLTATVNAATWGRAGPSRRTRQNLHSGTDRPDCR